MILGLIEHDRGTLNKASLEMLTLGRDLADELGVSLGAIVIGLEARPLADVLPAYGISRVFLIQHDRLVDYAPEAWAQSIIQLASAEEPQVIMAAGTDRGHEVLVHVAALMDLSLAANCIKVEPGNPYRLTRVRWGGSLLEEANLAGTPKLLTVALHMIPAAEESGSGEHRLETMTPTLADEAFRVCLTDRVDREGDKVSLSEARAVVGGGRGVGGREGFESLDELAFLINGAVGCSRAVTNHGWRPHADQIGQTGTRIAPDLYVACGISGAVQHMVGCKGAKKILVINTDPEAPIISKADYAVIGDLHEVVPALVEEIRRLRDE